MNNIKVYMKNKEGEQVDITSAVENPKDLSKVYILKFNQNFFGDNDIFDKNCLSKESIDKEIPVFEIIGNRENIGWIKINFDEDGIYISEHKLKKTLILKNLISGIKILDKNIPKRHEIGYDKERLFKNIEILDFIYTGE